MLKYAFFSSDTYLYNITQFHYYFIRSLYFIHSLFKTKNLNKQKYLKKYFCKNCRHFILIYLFVHLGSDIHEAYYSSREIKKIEFSIFEILIRFLTKQNVNFIYQCYPRCTQGFPKKIYLILSIYINISHIYLSLIHI